MNKRHILALSALTALLSCAVISCDRNDEETTPNFTTGFVTIFTGSDGIPGVLKNDYGNSYVIAGETEALKPDTLYRMMCSYAFNSDSTVTILQRVFAYSGRAAEYDDVDSLFRDDPVQINSMYIGGGFLNILMGIRVMNPDSKHTLGMVHVPNADSLIFTVHHDADGDGEGTTRYAYISMPLNGYGLGSGDTVFFRCRGYGKDYALKLLYR